MSSIKKAFRGISLVRILTFVFCIGMFLGCVAVVIARGVLKTAESDLRQFVVLGNAILWLIPFVMQWIFRDKISDTVHIFYAFYLLIASFFGVVLGFYSKVHGYDSAVHVAAGWVFSAVGLFVLCKMEQVDRLKPITVIVFCFAFTMAIAALWEIFEFTSDNVFGSASQVPTVLPDGSVVTLVYDTMKDIICNFSGGIVFIIQYVLHVCTKKSWLIGYMKRDFSAVQPTISETVSTEKE